MSQDGSGQLVAPEARFGLAADHAAAGRIAFEMGIQLLLKSAEPGLGHGTPVRRTYHFRSASGRPIGSRHP
jgi:hypothetical protein